MKISLSQNQWFDGQGYPLVSGRISVYLHGSDTLAEIYTLEGENYVRAANPVILDNDGRSDTLWFDAAIVDVLVEGFLGTPGQYWTVDTYQDGFAIPGAANETFVVGMGGLADANTGLGSVTVIGYNSANDCGPRSFVWDSTCTLPEDGGAIVASSGVENGRWILVSESKYMPSTWYGVRPGDESNMAAFLTYPEKAGQWNIVLPPVPRFLVGTYGSEGVMSTPKSIAFDAGAKFTKVSFVCRGAEVAPTDSYVADFQFTDQGRADSSWFRSVASFWGCGARELVQCPANHFTDTVFNSNRTVSSQRISGKAIQMSGTGVLTLVKCDIGPRALSTRWFTRFSGVSISDRMFDDSDWDFGQWPSHHTDCPTADLSNFESAGPYILWAAAYGVTRLDLQGRTGGSIPDTMPFTSIANGKFASIALGHSAELDRVECGSLTVGPGVASLSASQCGLALSGDIDTMVTAVDLVETDVAMGGYRIGPSDTSDTGMHRKVQLRECRLEGGSVYGCGIVMRGCNICDTRVYAYPYLDAGTWYLGLSVRGCVFEGGSSLRIGADSGSGTENPSARDVEIRNMEIVGNSFDTDSDGITMPFWAADMEHRFLKGIVHGMGWADDHVATDWNVKVLYSGNTGNCPRSYGVAQQDFNADLLHIIKFSEDNDSRKMRFTTGAETVSVFCVPVTESDGGSYVDTEWVIGDTAKAVTPYDPRYSPYAVVEGMTPCMFPYVMYTPLCAWDKTLANDAFSVIIGGSTNFLFAGAIPCPAAQ